MAHIVPLPLITGTGVFTCAGRTTPALWNSCLLGLSGIRKGLGEISDVPRDSTFFALEASHQALHQSGWLSLGDEDGLIVATTTGNLPVWEDKLIDHLKGRLDSEKFREFFQAQPLGSVLNTLKLKLGKNGNPFFGKSTLVSSACSAATQAIALGGMWIQQRQVKRVLIVGTEVLCRLTIEGFQSLQLLSSETCLPFDINRSGINLSEGAGAIFLETTETAKQKPLAILSGFGITTDGYHMTSPHPEGAGSFRAMKEALGRAKLATNAISWIHAHGTGSKHNDSAESFAIHSLFGEHSPPVTSTKNIHGHALGATGAIETALCVEALRHQKILPNFGHAEKDPSLQIHLAKKKDLSLPIRHILKNTLGFGGANSALILSWGENP